MKYSWKGHKDRNGYKNRIKSSGQARSVYVKNINRNICTTWRWVREEGHHNNKDLTYQAESGCPNCKPSSGAFSSCVDERTISGWALRLFIIQLLSHIAGDVHPTPWPKNTNKTNELSVIHVNVKSLKDEIDIIACDVENNEMVTISETWLSDQWETKKSVLQVFSHQFGKTGQMTYTGVLPSMLKMILFVNPDLTILFLFLKLFGWKPNYPKRPF